MSTTPRKGLGLDRVVLLGRTFEEYSRYFSIDPAQWRGRRVLDVASGVSSFAAEANALGLEVTACDPIYDLDVEVIRPRCIADLNHVLDSIFGLTVYRWAFYQNPERLRGFRERAYRAFLEDYAKWGRQRYVPGLLPNLPFADGTFDLTLVSYLLLVYEEQLDFDFHLRAVLELMRVTRGELRLYPMVNFEGERSAHLARLERELPALGFRIELIETDFEFLVGSHYYVRITRGPLPRA